MLPKSERAKEGDGRKTNTNQGSYNQTSTRQISYQLHLTGIR